MSKQAIALTVGLFAVIVAGMFVFAYLNRTEKVQSIPDTNTSEQPVAGPYDYIDRIEAKHFFANGVHTLVGQITMPTPCDLLDHSVTVAESFPEQVTVDFLVINNAEVCAQVVTQARFQVEVEASEDASFRAKFMGRDVELNLIPPAPGETPDDFELFIKG